MASKPSPGVSEEADSELRLVTDEVAALRNMSREERLALLMKGLDAACGPAPARRRESASPPEPKSRRKD